MATVGWPLRVLSPSVCMDTSSCLGSSRNRVDSRAFCAGQPESVKPQPARPALAGSIGRPSPSSASAAHADHRHRLDLCRRADGLRRSEFHCWACDLPVVRAGPAGNRALALRYPGTTSPPTASIGLVRRLCHAVRVADQRADVGASAAPVRQIRPAIRPHTRSRRKLQ